MPEKTYEMSFFRLDGSMDSGQTFSDLPTALTAFRCFVEPQSAELYSGITLMEHDWITREDRVIAALALDGAGREL